MQRRPLSPEERETVVWVGVYVFAFTVMLVAIFLPLLLTLND